MNISGIQNYRFNNYLGNKYVNKKQNNNSKVEFRGCDFNPFASSVYYDKEKFANDFMAKLQENKEKIDAYLSECTFDFEGNNAGITEHLRSFFTPGSEQYIERSLLHNTIRSKEVLENGFDFSKINTTNYGPGMYFGNSQGELEIYSGKTIQADFKGTYAIGDDLDKYNRLCEQVTNKMRECLGLSMEYTPTIMTEYEVMKKYADNYARNQIVNQLNIDGASCYGGRYFVVFNPNSLSNIREY